MATQPLASFLESGLVSRDSSILNLFDIEGLNSVVLSKSGFRSSRAATEVEMREIIKLGSHWDLVIATHGIDRFYATTTQADFSAFISWAKESSKFFLLTPEWEILDPSNGALGPQRMRPEVSSFRYVSELTTERDSPQERPVVLLSDWFLFDGLHWREHKDLVSPPSGAVDKPLNGGSIRRPRTFLHNEGTVIKCQVGNPDYFESLEIIREAECLQRLPPSVRVALQIPRLVRIHQGRSVTVTVRERVPGEPLVDQGEVTTKIPQIKILGKTLELATRYSQNGFFHNDFRPWNILHVGDELTMIDFSGLSRVDEDSRDLPQIIALAGTLIFLGDLDANGLKIGIGESFDRDVMLIMEDYLVGRNIRIGELYDEPWLALPTIGGSIEISLQMSAKELLDQLLAVRNGVF